MEPKKNINIITEQWPPFNYIENKELVGFSTEIVKLVMKDLMIDTPINVLPSARAMNILKNSKRTMFFSYIQTPERKDLFKWIGPFGEQAIYFYKRKNSPLDIRTIKDAKKVKSICSRGYGLVHGILVKNGFKNLDESATAKSIYLKAIKGRCDLSISETPLGYAYWMKKLKLPLDSLEKTPLEIIRSSLYIIATKDIPDEEVMLWQKSLDKIIKSKEYLKIKNKYYK